MREQTRNILHSDMTAFLGATLLLLQLICQVLVTGKNVPTLPLLEFWSRIETELIVNSTDSVAPTRSCS